MADLNNDVIPMISVFDGKTLEIFLIIYELYFLLSFNMKSREPIHVIIHINMPHG